MTLLFHFLLRKFIYIFLLCVVHFRSDSMSCFANKVPTFNALHCLFDVFYWHSFGINLYRVCSFFMLLCIFFGFWFFFLFFSLFFISLKRNTRFDTVTKLSKKREDGDQKKNLSEFVCHNNNKKEHNKDAYVERIFRVMWMRCDLFVTTESIGELRAKRLKSSKNQINL